MLRRVECLCVLPGQDGWYVESAGLPGVHVVEGYVKQLFRGEQKGFLQVRVDPGCKVVITPSRPVWSVKDKATG